MSNLWIEGTIKDYPSFSRWSRKADHTQVRCQWQGANKRPNNRICGAT